MARAKEGATQGARKSEMCQKLVFSGTFLTLAPASGQGDHGFLLDFLVNLVNLSKMTENGTLLASYLVLGQINQHPLRYEDTVFCHF